jgi:hypothetical protein
LPAFQSGGCAGGILKYNSLSETILTVLKTIKIGSCRFSKALAAAPRNLLPSRTKERNLPVLKSFQQNQKFGNKQIKAY